MLWTKINENYAQFWMVRNVLNFPIDLFTEIVIIKCYNKKCIIIIIIIFTIIIYNSKSNLNQEINKTFKIKNKCYDPKWMKAM